MQIYGKDRHGVREGTLEMFFEEMRFAFKDPQLQQKALARLNTLRQGKRDFREFLGEFEQLLLEAGGHGWDDNVKRGFLDVAINQDMRKALISLERKTELTAYCRQLQEVAIRTRRCLYKCCQAASELVPAGEVEARRREGRCLCLLSPELLD